MLNNSIRSVLNKFIVRVVRLPHVRKKHRQTKEQKLNPEYVDNMPVSNYIVSPHKRNRIYVWGNVRTGALGIPQPKEKENLHQVQYYKCPKRMHFAEKSHVFQVATGYGFTLFGMENEVFGSGLNTDSQIGYHEFRQGKPLELLFIPKEIHLASDRLIKDLKIIKVAAGRAHSAILTNHGLFLLGCNAYGQCARRIIENENYTGSTVMTHINDIDGKLIKDVICGQDHTLIILDDGSVYGCGWGADGQTGLGHYNNSDTFSKLQGDIEGENITKIASRSDFVLAINDKQQVFGWGNTEYSQMILNDDSQQVASPSHIPMLENKGICDVDTGGSFCIALNNEGDVFVWGFGILGVGPQVQESREALIIPRTLFGYNAFNDTESVISVHAGLSHMAAITKHGNLYTWGRNRSSCLGLGIDKDQYFPLKVAMGGAVKNVSCGFDHTVAICSSYITSET